MLSITYILVLLCGALIALGLVGAGIAVYWQDREQKVLPAILVGIGLLLLACGGLAALYVTIGRVGLLAP
jgi:hypothetical protein